MNTSPPYVIFPMDAALALAAQLSPQLDCDLIHRALEDEAASIASMPLDAPQRQLLAALRWRARWLANPSSKDRREPRDNDVRHWLTLQSGCPLNA